MKASHIILAVASAAALVSCSGKVCKVKGTVSNIDGIENPEVWVVESREKIDTVSVVDGAFTYTCPLDDAKMLTVLVASNGRPVSRKHSTRFVPDGKNVTITLDTLSSVAGSPMTDLFKSVMDGVGAKVMEGGPDAVLEYLKQSYRDNCQNIVGEKVLEQVLPRLSVEEMDEFIAMGTEKIKTNENYQRIRNAKVAAEASAIGKDYIDFGGVTPDGAAIKLSDFVGKSKLTLVDFWASWCGPCMASMPKMVERWNNWQKKGLGIVGVAVWDGDNSASRAKITEKGMAWPQIFVGDDKSSTEAYGINGIPHVLLLDADGKILFRGHPEASEVDAIIAEKL